MKGKLLYLPFDGLLKIWKYCFINNPSERDKLNTLDDTITKRSTLISKGHLMVQLAQSEIDYLKNLYESVI